jgi:hypothetical protein
VTTELPPIPPGPADTTHPRRTLARLALSYAYYEAADFAGGVPTVSDEYGDPYDYVDHAARLLSIAQDVLSRAVVYARERAGSWADIADALNITEQQASARYSMNIDTWEDALNRPWERSGRFLHLKPNDGARHNARHDGIEDRMVSANLPEHTPVTEFISLTRTAAHFIQSGTAGTEAEREAYETRKTAVVAKISPIRQMD